LPWDEQVAAVDGDFRASCLSVGITLGALDMMVVAHAIATNTILVTHDKAFSLVPDGVLTLEDWMNGA
jgi:tRNA(fMet)-specific endonuclease VapC